MGSSIRPFDDARYPDLAGKGDCFLCGKRVDPHDSKRGTFSIGKGGPELPLHLPCLGGREMFMVCHHYRTALHDMVQHPTPLA